MSAARSCDRCGTAYIAKNSRSRYCTDICRAKSSQERRLVSAGTEVPVGDGLVSVVTRRLEVAERLDTPCGQSAVILARRIQQATDSGAGLARLVEVLRSTMVVALEGVAVEADDVDEIRARRDAKHGRATAG